MSLLNLLGQRDRGTRRRPSRPGFRPTIDSLEDRMVLSASMVDAMPLTAAQVRPTTPAFEVLPLNITSITNQGGQLLANVALGSTTTQVPVTISLAPSSTAAVPVLDLRLDEIHLDLLGLKVDTSDICLKVDAVPGSGNLLGNLLADVANLLNGGTSIGDVLNGQGGTNALTPTELTSLTGGLTNLLNGALDEVTSSSSVTSATAGRGGGRTMPNSTSVLNLSLGPVNLNLLGLNVKLDDCDNGPVRVAITAEPGPGRLLGNLIGNVANLLNRPGRNQAPQLARRLQGVSAQIQQISSTPAFEVLPLNITSITNQGGQLLANVALGSTTTQVPVTISLAPSSTAAVPVLDLRLGEIHLDLLGLKVDTSEICLKVNAVPGSGNLLGNLLAGVANLLNGGTSIGDVLNGQGGTNALTPTELTSLTGGLTNLLNGALDEVTSSSSVTSATAGRGGGRRTPTSTSVLNLSLGPVNLNLLGLNVKLDDCDNGPVRVAITAEPGPGRLLGNLIGNIANLLNRPGRNQAPQLVGRLQGVTSQIQQLI